MPRVVLLTGHHPGSRRRAGFHWLAHAYRELGYDVTFATLMAGPINWIRRDYRNALITRDQRNRLFECNGLEGFVWWTPYHPFSTGKKLLNLGLWPLFELYPRLPLGQLGHRLRQADLVIFESTPGIMLAKRIRNLAPKARLIYRVSDDLVGFGAHPAVTSAEMRALNYLDQVSVPSPWMKARFQHAACPVDWHMHGINKTAFDQAKVNPYEGQKGPHAVWVGTAKFDAESVRILADTFPHVTFHLIGPIPQDLVGSNVRYYGEMAFADTVGFIKFADVGLATWIDFPGLESLSHSLKVVQYAYCRLPTLGPEPLANKMNNLVTYKRGDPTSLTSALQRALAFDRDEIKVDAVRSWKELAACLAAVQAAELLPSSTPAHLQAAG